MRQPTIKAFRFVPPARGIVSHLLLCAIALLLLLTQTAFASDPDTFSPVVSYQYYDSLNEDTNSTILSPGVSYQFYDSLNEDASSTVLSTVVSYQFYDSLNEDANSMTISPVVSFQYFDWAGDAILQFQPSPYVSYFYNVGPAGPEAVVSGRVVDPQGKPIAGATVSASILKITQATTQTAADGSYALSPLVPGVYVLAAAQPGYASSGRAFTLSAATAIQNFQLATLAAPPPVAQTTRQPPANLAQPPIEPLGALTIFDGQKFVPIDAQHMPAHEKMTIVLSHGWIPTLFGKSLSSGIDGWPTDMAAHMLAQQITPGVANIANILAWDWSDAATTPLPFPPVELTQEEGLELGRSLQGNLGMQYSQTLHFLGHSLGTMVNAAAINYLHGECGAQQEVSPTPWTVQPIYVTLFDEAETANAAQVFFDGISINDNPGGTLQGATGVQAWFPPMPVHCDWADNYVSLVGFYEPKAVNALLRYGIALDPLSAGHSYPMKWYDLSIANPLDPTDPLGFQLSSEYDKASGLPPSTFPPLNNSPSLGSAYIQVTELHELALVGLPSGLDFVVSSYGDLADVVVQGAVIGAQGGALAVQVAGDVAVDIKDGAVETGQLVSQGVGYVANAAVQTGDAVANLFDSAYLHLTLRSHSSGSARVPGPQSSAPMAWVPVEIPGNATAMAFDFAVDGDPKDDALVCGIGDTNLFSLSAKFVPTNIFSASRLIDVSSWGGQQVEIFFGLIGGTSTNCTLQVENIRFFSLAPPSLSITQTNGVALLSWSSTANGYVLESTPDLASPSWQALTNAPALFGGQFTVTNSLPDQSRFFRLRHN